MFRSLFCALLIAVVAAAGVTHAQSKKGPNGGLLAKSQGHPIEFVVNGQDIVFYIGDDDGSPLSTKTMRGRATVQEAGKTTTVQLTPAEPNKMIGKAAAPIGSKARVVLSGSLHGHSLTARFVTE